MGRTATGQSFQQQFRCRPTVCQHIKPSSWGCPARVPLLTLRSLATTYSNVPCHTARASKAHQPDVQGGPHRELPIHLDSKSPADDCQS